jgi:hypothetical protein
MRAPDLSAVSSAHCSRSSASAAARHRVSSNRSATAHASPQPFLPELDQTEWRPAQRLAPYRPRRFRRSEGTQAQLLAPEAEPTG